MKTIKLISLEGRNFQGGTFRLDANGGDISVFAANGVGKTRMASLFSWLLFDKDSLGRTDFEIKNLDATGEAEHNLEHGGSMILEVDGTRIELAKSYHEVYTKKRGSATDSFTGHTTDHFIDGVPVQKKEYVAKIAEIAGDENIFRLLTSPTAFPSLPWQKQRSILLEVCGDMTDSDVISTTAELTPLNEALAKHKASKSPIEDHKKIITARRAEINKKMVELPARIDEVRRSLPDIAGLNRQSLSAQISSLESQIADAQLRLKGVDTGGQIAEHLKRIAVINSELQRMENKHYSETMQTVNRINQQVSDFENRLRTSRNRVASIDSDIARKESAVNRLNSDLDASRAKWTDINSEQFKDGTPDTCYACQQPLPAERVHEAREKALAAFNDNKANRLADNERRGHQMADERNRLNDEINALRAERETVSIGIPELESSLQSATSERDSVRMLATDYSTLPGRAELISEKSGLEKTISDERNGNAQDSGKIQTEIPGLRTKLGTAKEQADRFVRRESAESRINDLKTDEKNLAAEFERLEQQLYLCDLFIKTKVQLLTDRINKKFEFTRFRLFNTLVNQGIEPTCEIMHNGVGYNSGLNSAARTNSGMDIIKTLQRHYNISPVVFVDNAESIVSLTPMDCQVIRLVVSGNDTVLRIEVESKEKDYAVR